MKRSVPFEVVGGRVGHRHRRERTIGSVQLLQPRRIAVGHRVRNRFGLELEPEFIDLAQFAHGEGRHAGAALRVVGEESLGDEPLIGFAQRCAAERAPDRADGPIARLDLTATIAWRSRVQTHSVRLSGGAWSGCTSIFYRFSPPSKSAPIPGFVGRQPVCGHTAG